MHITYSEESDTVYISLDPSLKDKKGAVHHTEEAGRDVLVDYADAEESHLVGIDVLNASKLLNIESLKSVTFERIDRK